MDTSTLHMKRTIAVSVALILVLVSWALLLMSSGPYAPDAASVIGAELVVLGAIAITGMVVSSSRWGRWLAIGVAVLGPLFGIGIPTGAWWVSNLVVSALVLAALAGSATSGVIRRLPSAVGPTPRVVSFTLVLVALPLLVATASPEGLGRPEWIMIGTSALAAGLYSKAGPLAVAFVRGVLPVASIVAAVFAGLPRAMIWIAIGTILTVFAWHKDIRLAVRPLVEQGRAVPMLPEMVPPDILEAAGLDERGRRPRS